MTRRPLRVGDRVRIVFALGVGHNPPDIPDGCVGRVFDDESERYVGVQFRGGKRWHWASNMFVLVSDDGSVTP